MSGQRKALIFANDQYDQEALRDLLAPAADAEALGRVLGDRQIGDFTVQVVRNEPAHVISAHIEELFSESRSDDVLLLHFSGHGLKSESGELFFAASNTRPNRLGSTAVSADFVRRCMQASRSRSVVVLLDCCYGGAFAQGVKVRAAGDINVLDSFPQEGTGGGRGRAVITASNAMEYAFEGDRLADDQHRRPSVFTSALVEGLATGDADRDEDGWVSLDELYDYIFDKVREQNPHQTPSRQVELEGELYLARSHRRRIRPAPIPPDLQAAVTDPNMFARLGAVSELRSRLTSDNLPVAAGAYEALAELARTDIRSVADPAGAALSQAALHPEETELHFGRIEEGSAPPHRAVRLLGPPIARACSPRASQDWIRVNETAEGFDISVDTANLGTRRGTLDLKGPTGEAVIAIDVEILKTPSEEQARREAVQAAEREAQEQARREAVQAAEREAQEQARREAVQAAEREAQEQARREAVQAAEREAQEQARREAVQAAERETQEQARREAVQAAERETQEQARREAVQAAERETQEQARREAVQAAEREAEEQARRTAPQQATTPAIPVGSRPSIRRKTAYAGSVIALLAGVTGLISQIIFSQPGGLDAFSFFSIAVYAVLIAAAAAALLRLHRLVIIGFLQGMVWIGVPLLVWDIVEASYLSGIPTKYLAAYGIGVASDVLGVIAAILLIVSWSPAADRRRPWRLSLVPMLLLCGVGLSQVAELIFIVNVYRSGSGGSAFYAEYIVALLVGLAVTWYAVSLRARDLGGAVILGWVTITAIHFLAPVTSWWRFISGGNRTWSALGCVLLALVVILTVIYIRRPSDPGSPPPADPAVGLRAGPFSGRSS